MHQSQGYYISSIYRHLQIYLNHSFEGLGFGSGQYLFFNHISRNEGITQKELSRLLAIDKATTAKAVHKLTKLGYIKQQQNFEDKRFNNLFLTEKGKDVLPEIREICRGTRRILQNGFSTEETKQSLKLLDVMLNNILCEVEKIRNNNDK